MSTWTRKQKANLRLLLSLDLSLCCVLKSHLTQSGPNRPTERGFFLYTPPRLQTACFSFVLIFFLRHVLAWLMVVEFFPLYITAESHLHQIYFSWRQPVSLASSICTVVEERLPPDYQASRLDPCPTCVVEFMLSWWLACGMLTTFSSLYPPRPAQKIMATKRTCLIIGATTGIGKETAEHLARKGWFVIVTGRNQDKGNKVSLAIQFE